MSDAEDWISRAIEADKGNDTMFDLSVASSLYEELLTPTFRPALSDARSAIKEPLA